MSYKKVTRRRGCLARVKSRDPGARLALPALADRRERTAASFSSSRQNGVDNGSSWAGGGESNEPVLGMEGKTKRHTTAPVWKPCQVLLHTPCRGACWEEHPPPAPPRHLLPQDFVFRVWTPPRVPPAPLGGEGPGYLYGGLCSAAGRRGPRPSHMGREFKCQV